MTRSRTLLTVSGLVACALLLALPGSSGAERFTSHLDELEQYLVDEEAKANAAGAAIASAVKLGKLVKKVRSSTDSHMQEIKLLRRIGQALLPGKGVWGRGVPAAEDILDTACRQIAADLRSRLEEARQELEGMPVRPSDRRTHKKALFRTEDALADLEDYENQDRTFWPRSFTQSGKLLKRWEKTARWVERKLEKFRRRLPCPGRIFELPDGARVTRSIGPKVEFDTYAVIRAIDEDAWYFDLYRCEPRYFEFRLLLRITDDGQIRREIFFVPPGQDPGDYHFVGYRESADDPFAVGFSGVLNVSAWDPVAGNVTLDFFASNGVDTLTGELSLTDWKPPP